MKTKKLTSLTKGPRTSSGSDVQREMDNFLRALRSYPDRFAREPYLSFQQHLSSMVAADHQNGGDPSHNGSRHR